MSRIKTAIAFTRNIATVGAFRQSSAKVEKEVCSKLSADKPVQVIEFGMGHGNITREILKRITKDSKLISFEINEEFCEHVEADLQDDRLQIVNDNAENFLQHIDSPVDFFIASLPFSFLSKESRTLLGQNAYEALEPGGYFSQFLYNRFVMRPFKKAFDDMDEVPFFNIPMEYVLHWKKFSNA